MKKRNMVSTTSTRDVVLGFLAHGPMSGYDIRRWLGNLSWLVDSPSFASLYPGLHTLLADGLVTVEVISSEGKPSRKVYTITEAGTEALQEGKPAGAIGRLPEGVCDEAGPCQQPVGERP